MKKNPPDPVFCTPLQVIRRKDEPVERLVKRFSKLVRNEDILKQHVESKRFVKPADKRRKKARQARWNATIAVENRKKV